MGWTLGLILTRGHKESGLPPRLLPARLARLEENHRQLPGDSTPSRHARGPTQTGCSADMLKSVNFDLCMEFLPLLRVVLWGP